MQPRPLFDIQWDDSASGYGWTVVYYLTWVPFFRRYVVTASADSAAALGYYDFALGAFRVEEPIRQAIRDIIRDDWKRQHKEGGQQRWARVLRRGFVTDVENGGGIVGHGSGGIVPLRAV